MEEAVTQHTEGVQPGAQPGSWLVGSSLQGLLSFVLILSTGGEVSLKKMMVVTDKWFLLVTDKCFY